MKNMTRFQRGMSMWELMLLFGIIGFVLTCAMSLGPHYMDDQSVASALKNVHKDLSSKDIYEVTNTEIKGRLSKYFQVSTIDNEIEKSLEITRDGGQVLVTMNYEVREPFMGNIDVVLRFEHQEDFAKPIEGDK